MREMRWTDEQAEAIGAEGQVLLTASAGTGKTTTVVGKILWLLGLDVGVRDSDGFPIPPCRDPCGLEEVAAITFTEKAAYDLKRKLRKEIEDSERGEELRWEVDRASVGTIHAFCGEILRDHALRLGIEPNFRVLDERESRLRQDEIVREVVLARLETEEPAVVELVRRCSLHGRGTYGQGVVDHVREAIRDVRWRGRRYDAWCRDGRLDPDLVARCARKAGGWSSDPEEEGRDRDALALAAALHSLAREAAERWSAWLEEEGVRDFDSLVLDARRLLAEPETRPALESLRRRFRILIIDEFQDTDAAQGEIAALIAGLEQGLPADGSPDLFLVGDPKQSIYRFRGADVSVWNEVAGSLGRRGRLLELSHNFRSEPPVVRFVNRVGAYALGEPGKALADEAPESRVDYSPLVAGREAAVGAPAEWVAVEVDGLKAEKVEAEVRLVASRIRRMVDEGERVVDPERGGLRPCAWRDVAVLARTRQTLARVETALREYGVPSYNTATAGLAERQEVLDLVTVLRLLDAPHDDLRALAFLRSPFVGLRDEVLARIRTDEATGRSSLVRQAERYLEAAAEGSLEPFPDPEEVLVEEVEREALARGLAAIRHAGTLVDRVDAAELLEGVLQETGYRLHLFLRPGAPEALANLERFLALLEEYRHLPLGSFLDLWARWGEQDLGIPQAPLYSQADDVVTLSTIHSAKGLEWPVVFLAGTEDGPDTSGRSLSGSFWSDPRFGPVFMPNKTERGTWCQRLFRRALLEDHAEEARLLYVATTRARDRLVVSGPVQNPGGYGRWLASSLKDSAEVRRLGPASGPPSAEADPGGSGELAGRTGAAGSGGDRRLAARDEDPVTGTGGQIDAFGEDEREGDGQLSLFGVAASAPVPGVAGGGGFASGLAGPSWSVPLVLVRRAVADSIQIRLQDPPVSLDWLDNLRSADRPDLVRALDEPPPSFVSSATELRLRSLDMEAWELRYRHGVEPGWRFAPDGRGGRIPPELRGQLIHGVLERVEEEREISRILEETLAEIDAPELERLRRPEDRYREALEREITEVVRGPEWSWYVEGPNWRELPFVHLAGRRDWRIGAFDLYRPAGGASPPERLREEWEKQGAEIPTGSAEDWIVDFKTHRVDGKALGRTAREYRVQAAVYREAAAIRGPARVLLHFTWPNRAVVSIP